MHYTFSMLKTSKLLNIKKILTDYYPESACHQSKYEEPLEIRTRRGL